MNPWYIIGWGIIYLVTLTVSTIVVSVSVCIVKAVIYPYLLWYFQSEIRSLPPGKSTLWISPKEIGRSWYITGNDPLLINVSGGCEGGIASSQENWYKLVKRLRLVKVKRDFY